MLTHGWTRWTGINDQQDWVYPNEWFHFKVDEDPPQHGMGVTITCRAGVTVKFVGKRDNYNPPPHGHVDNTVHVDITRSQINNLRIARQNLELMLIDSYIEAPE